MTTHFQHDLQILPPVLEGGRVTWWAYLDSPNLWQRSAPTIGELLGGNALGMLRRLLAFERSLPSAPQRRPGNMGVSRRLPDLQPRWAVRITADNEEDPLWSIEVLDESAWGRTNSDLRSAMAALARRIEEAKVEAVTIEALQPPAIMPANNSHTTFEDVTTAAIAVLIDRIATKAREAEEIREEMAAMQAERRALHAALTAYRKHRNTGAKRRRLEAVS